MPTETVVPADTAATETERSVPGDATLLAGGANAKVVASTSWAAAIAKMAGARNISVVVPADVIDQSTYEPGSSELAQANDAELVLFAGLEGFAKRLTDSAGSTTRVDLVSLTYDPALLGPEVMDFSALFGTTDIAAANIAAYTDAYRSIADGLRAGIGNTSQVVVAQTLVADWAGFAGWSAAATFGPKAPTASGIAGLAAIKPTVILDNKAMPGGKPVADASGAKLVSVGNYPGADFDLIAVVQKNADAIGQAFD